MNSFIFYAEVHPTLWKGCENRKQNTILSLSGQIFRIHSFFMLRCILPYGKVVKTESAEVHPTLCRHGDFAPCGVNFPDIHLHGDTLSEFLDV